MGARAAVLFRVARQRGLPRLELAFACFAVAEHATWLAVLVFAYERGGAREAGVIAAVQLIPAGVAAPFAAFAGDRFRPDRALAAGFVAQSATMVATAAAMAAGNGLLAYTAATATAVAVTFSRPVVGALLPVITATTADLVAANVIVDLVAQGGLFAGPLLGAALLAAFSPSVVFAAGAAATLLAAMLSVRLPSHAAAPYQPTIDAGGLLVQLLAGVRALRDHVTMRTVVWLGALAAFSGGVSDVLAVLFAEARLAGGGAQAGVLGGAVGVGAMLGAAVCTGLIGGTRAALYLAGAAALLAAPYAALVPVDAPVAAVALFVLVGAGHGAMQLSTEVAVQRRAPSGALARIFGVAESLHMFAVAGGSLLLTVAVDRFGLRTSLYTVAIAIGAIAGLLVVRFLVKGGDVPPPPAAVVARLRADAILAPLGLSAIERLAAAAERLRLTAGTVIVRQGLAGDSYFLIVDGRVSVGKDGIEVNRLGPGDSFGEIALLRDIPRTATITAITDVDLLSITRDPFLEAVTGHPRSLAVADDVATGLLSR